MSVEYNWPRGPVQQRRTTMFLMSLLVLGSVQSVVHTLSVNHRYADLLQQRQQELLDNDDDMSEMDYAKNFVKRDGSKGTCTCTCETRPVQHPEQQQQQAAAAASGIQTPSRDSSKTPIESASLIRTAARMEANHQRPAAAAAAGEMRSAAGSRMEGSKVNGASHQFKSNNVAQIVRIPPLNDVIIPEHDSRVEEQGQGQGQTNEEWNSLVNGGQDSWGHGSRFPWRRLPDTMCYREQCQSDKECCLRFNLCDKSAHVCVDCWYGSTCTSERECCFKYPYCQREWKTGPDGQQQVVGGKCVSEM